MTSEASLLNRLVLPGDVPLGAGLHRFDSGGLLVDMTDLIRLVDFVGTGVLVPFAFVIWRARKRDHDARGGQWLAASWGLLLTATMVGTAERFYQDAPLTHAWPFTVIGICCGLIAMKVAIERGEDAAAKDSETGYERSRRVRDEARDAQVGDKPTSTYRDRMAGP